MSDHWQKLKELLLTASDVEPAARAEFLSAACGEDAGLRQEAESILASSDAAPSFLQGSAIESFPILFEPERAKSLIGQKVGAYRLVESLATGGMGTVYLGERADGQFTRTVAVKLLRHRLATDAMVERFRKERQLLATLDHPNIAKLLDGGVTDEALPYLVMEHVAGSPIHRHCDERKLTTVQRLELFRKVSAAVEYAHQNLIVHRDLKPENVLVTAAGEPKLLDFGIATVLSGPHEAAEHDWNSGARIMTPEYASPEQILGRYVTTRSDVYSLGVILYELLTGHRPYVFRDRTRSEIERTIREENPEKPSTVITRVVEVQRSDGTTSRLTPELVCATREATPNRLRRRLSGDLDAIIMTALQKESDRRYASVEQFSEDIRRHLAGLPVTVRQDSLTYRSAKCLARNAKILAAVAAVILMLIYGWVATDRQRQAAEREAGKASQANMFLQGMLSAVNPKRAEGGELTVREVLDEASVRLDDGALDAQPEAEADVRTLLSTSYRELGLYESSLRQVDIALRIHEEALGGDHPDLIEVLNARGLLFKAMGRYDDAERSYRRALALRSAADEQDEPAVAEIMNNLGVVLRKSGRWEEAESLYRQVLETRRRLYGDRHRDVATTMTNLAAVLKNRGEYDASESLYRESLSIFRSRPNDRLRVTSCLNNLALLLTATERHEEAEAMLRESLVIRRRTHGDEHPEVALALHNLALALREQDRLDEAEDAYREALRLRRKLLPDDHPYLAYTMNNLAELLSARSEYDEAESLCREALAIRQRALPQEHPDIAGSLLVLGQIHLARGEIEFAEPALRSALAICEARFQPEHAKTVRAKCELGRCLVRNGEFDEAEALLLAAHHGASRSEHSPRRLRLDALQRLVELYESWSRPDSAAEYAAMLDEAAQDN